MFSAFAGAVMAAKVHFTQAKYNITRKQDKQVSEMLYKNEVNKIDETEKYGKQLLPESGYMTLEEYEEKSRGESRKSISSKILDKAEFPKDENYVYYPEYKFKLVKYNDPIGTPELTLPRKLNFDRQINAQGIISGDFTKLVYPSVYYYAQSDCTSCDLFLINLNTNLSKLDRVQKANVVNKENEPLISTSKDIDVKFVFRTLTPIDFSKDNNKLIVKEKIGYRHDGIWKTELWVYNFNSKKGKKLSGIRDYIIDYWKETKNINLKEHRWDIYPLGFDADNDNRAVVSAYAFTGETPMFLGIWSIDVNGYYPKLESITNSFYPITSVGYRLAEEDSVIPVSEKEFDSKQIMKEKQLKDKQEKADKKFEDELKKVEYERKIQQMDMETLLKIKEHQENLKKIYVKNQDGYTGD